MGFSISARHCGATLAAFCLGLVLNSNIAQADEATVGRVFILGDSLSDGGAYSDFVVDSFGLPPSTFYRFTNNKFDGSGLTFAEQFAALNGATTSPFVVNDGPAANGNAYAGLDGGTNFAQGGSRVEQPNGIGNEAGGNPFITTVPVLTQITQAIALAGGTFNDNDVITITAGANDIFAATVPALVITDPATDLINAAAALGQGVRQLEAAGAKNIIVFTVPNVAQTPSTLDAAAADPGNAAAIIGGATALGNLYNSQLVNNLNGTNAVLFDLGKLTDAANADPARYGFGTGLVAQDGDGSLDGTACQGNAPPGDESSLFCLEGVNPAITPAGGPFLFADGVHPTAEGHAIIAQAVQAMLTGATETARLLESLQQTQRLSDLWREDRLRPTALFYLNEQGGWVKREDDDLRVFFVGNYNSAETESDPVFGGAESEQLTGTIALDAVFGGSMLFGGEFSIGGGEIDLGSTDAKWKSYGLGLYGLAMIFDGFYLNTAGGLEFLAFDELDRTVALGPSVETYEADPSAKRLYFRIGGGASVPIAPDILLTPEAAYAFDMLRIDSYEEEEGAASVAYGENEIQSNRLIGALSLDAAPASLPGWSFSLRGAYEYEIDDDRHEISVGSNPSGRGVLSLERFDGSHGTVSGKIGRAIGGGVLSIGGGATVPTEDGETGYTGTVSFEMGL